jgi:hypothetical protein
VIDFSGVPDECREGFFSPSGRRSGIQRKTREAHHWLWPGTPCGPWVSALARKSALGRDTMGHTTL